MTDTTATRYTLSVYDVDSADIETQAELHELMFDYYLSLPFRWRSHDNSDGLVDKEADAIISWYTKETPYVTCIARNNDGVMVGFCIVLHEKLDNGIERIHIGEFGVKSEERGRGVGRFMVSQLLDILHGTYELEILELNEAAKEFWHEVFISNGYEEELVGDAFMEGERLHCMRYVCG